MHCRQQCMLSLQGIPLTPRHIDAPKGRFCPYRIAPEIRQLFPAPGGRVPFGKRIFVIPNVPIRIGLRHLHRVKTGDRPVKSVPGKNLLNRSPWRLHGGRRRLCATYRQRPDDFEGLRQI